MGAYVTQDPNAAGGISGSGTANYLAMFTSASTIGNSQIFQSGSKVYISAVNTFAVNTSTIGLSIGYDQQDVTIAGVNYNIGLSIHNNSGTYINQELHAASATATLGAVLIGTRSRGTYASPTAVTSGDNMFDIYGVGHDGTDYAIGAGIEMEVNGTVSNNIVPGLIRFLTTNTSGTLTSQMTINSSGQVNIGNYASPANLRALTVGQDTAYMSFGSWVGLTGNPAIYMNQATPDSTNYVLATSGASTYLNAPTNGTVNIAVASSNKFSINNAGVTFTFTAQSSGAITNYNLNIGAHTGQTASAEIPNFKLTGASKTWAAGAITTQRWNYFSANTAAFASASTITDSYGLYVEAATAGTNATITNNYAAGFGGAINVIDGTSRIILREGVSLAGFGAVYGSASLTPSAANMNLLFGSTGTTYINAVSGQTVIISNSTNTICSFSSSTQTYSDSINVTFGSTTGTKLGTATSQKLSFWNATPIVQPTNTTAIDTLLVNTGLQASGGTINYFTNGLNIGNYATPATQRLVTIGQDTAWVSIGSLVGATSQGAIYINKATPSATNYSMTADAATTVFNSVDSLAFKISAIDRLLIRGATTSGANPNFDFTTPANTGQTASTESPTVRFSGASKTWSAGAITTQRWNYFSANTAAFASASIITNSYGLYVEAATAGTNATITNNYAIGANGNIITELSTGVNIIARSGTGGSARFQADRGNTSVSADITYYTGSTAYWSVGLAASLSSNDYCIRDQVAGTNRFVMLRNSVGQAGFGVTSPSALIHIAAGTATASTAPLKFTTGTFLTTPEQGACEYDGFKFSATPVTYRRDLMMSIDAKTSDTTVANTTTETTVYTSNLDANSFFVGKVLSARVLGIYSTANASDTFTIRLKIGGTTVLTATSNAKNVTNTPFDIEFISTIRSIGVSGTVISYGKIEADQAILSSGESSTTSIDTTTTNTIIVTIEWSNALSGNTLTSQQGITRHFN